MAGLCVIASSDASESNHIETMLARMSHYPWLRAVHVPIRSGAVGVVTFDRSIGTATARSADGRFVAALDGEFFDTRSSRDRFAATGVLREGASDADLLIEGFRQDGDAFLATLNGEFAAALWDDRDGLLHLITDRFGLRPLYCVRSRHGIAAAAEIKALLAVGTSTHAWSREGVAQFFAFGHFYNDDTLLEGIRALPAATRTTYRVADATCDERTYWRLAPTSSATSDADVTAAFEERLLGAVARRARAGERLGLSLSGGLDARTILGVMPAGVDLQTVSLGMDGSLDHKSASAMAAAAGVPHHAYVLDRDFLSAFEQHLRQMVYLTDGHYVDQGIVMPTMRIYRDLGIEYLMRGHGGELLHMRKAYAFSLDDEALGATETGIEQWLFAHLTGYMLSGVPDDLFTFDVREAARASLARALARCAPGQAPVDRVWQLFLNERLHRETALSMHTFGCFAQVRQPYLDNDLIDVVFSMPARMKLGDDLQTAVLRHRRPAFLDITNANTGARLGAGPIETSLARLRLKVFAKLGIKGYQPYERLGLWLRRELRPFVEGALTDEQFLDQDVIRPDVVKRIVAQHASQQANHTFLIMSLVIFALGQQVRARPSLEVA